jgi:predicted GIY-YIG superfamily endonuclease
MWYVYDLINSKKETVYVGQTMQPSKRLSTHLKSTSSKFYKQNFFMVIISTWPTKATALIAEGVRKLELGMEWTEKTGCAAGGKTSGRIAVESGQLASARSKEASSAGGKAASKIVNAMRVQCPYCNMISNPGVIGYHKKSCKNKSA